MKPTITCDLFGGQLMLVVSDEDKERPNVIAAEGFELDEAQEQEVAAVFIALSNALNGQESINIRLRIEEAILNKAMKVETV